MSSNFHNLWGMHLVGLEFHDYQPEGLPLLNAHPHATGQFWFLQPMATTWKKAANVSAEKWSMIQQGYDFYAVAHCPLPIPPPGASTAVVLGMVIATSGSKCQMAVQSVTSGGNPLACCISSMISANVNCSDPVDVPFNLVMNLNSVETTPTAGDYAGAAAAGLLDAAVGATFGMGVGRAKEGIKTERFNLDLLENVVKQTFRRTPDVVKSIEQYTTTPLAEFVKQMVDGSSS